jgi:putative ABC transport system substrate-binding protein
MNKLIQLLLIVIIIILIILLVTIPRYITIYNIKNQDKDNIKTVGIARWVSNSEYDKNIQGFKDALENDGFIEGKNIKFIIENPEANKSKQKEIIQSFIDKKVDLIYSLTTPGTLIAKELVKNKPIVFSIVTFPVDTGIISSLENSGNNIVGTRNYISIEKQYSQFEKIFPNTKKLAFVHRKNEPNSVIQYNEMSTLLNKKGIEILDIAAIDLEDIKTQLNNKINSIDSLYSACDTLIQAGGEEIVIEISKRYKKPSFTCNKDGVKKGALIGDITDFYNIGKTSGRQAALILNGANPSSLLTESPGEDYIIINTKTASEIGIVIPSHVLNETNEIIVKDMAGGSQELIKADKFFT